MIANQITGLLTGGVAASLADYESIATTTLTGNQSSITFTGISSSYSHLQLRITGKDDRALNRDSVKMQFNSDTASNYSWHYLSGDGASAAASAGTSTSFIELFRVSGNSSAANIFGAMVVDVLDYANANKYKTSRALGGVDFNGSGEIFLTSGNWRNTAAVTSITLTPGNATNFMQYSSFALYGIK
jgi:hypothetical protein